MCVSSLYRLRSARVTSADLHATEPWPKPGREYARHAKPGQLQRLLPTAEPAIWRVESIPEREKGGDTRVGTTPAVWLRSRLCDPLNPLRAALRRAVNSWLSHRGAGRSTAGGRSIMVNHVERSPDGEPRIPQPGIAELARRVSRLA
jgi:hypothetical protein